MLMDLASTWRARAEQLRPYSPPAATAFEEAAADLERELHSLQGEPLTLVQAEAESGYSADYLGKLVRKGKIPNAGRPNAPKILRRDLPRKASRLPSSVPTVKLVGATPGQIARAVVASSHKGDPR